MRFANPLPLLFSLSLLLAAGQSHALSTDSNQPIRVQADSAELDDGKGVATYRGNVVITQGSLRVTGDTVTLTQSNQGDIEIVTATGKPATYEQKPAADKELVKASGMTIQYFASREQIVLTDRARLEQAGNTFDGEKIVYDAQRQIVNAGRASGGNVTAPRPRIDMVIQPRKKNEPAAGAQ